MTQGNGQIKTAAKIIHDADEVIRALSSELTKHRIIVERYYQKYGEEVQGGDLSELPDSIEFNIDLMGDKVICKRIDHNKTGLSSLFQIIKYNVKKLIN
jgi:hypothetical protein